MSKNKKKLKKLKKFLMNQTRFRINMKMEGKEKVMAESYRKRKIEQSQMKI